MAQPTIRPNDQSTASAKNDDDDGNDGNDDDVDDVDDDDKIKNMPRGRAK